MKSRGNKKKLSFEQKICLAGYLLIPIFFVILYFLMTETYEDVMQSNSDASTPVFDILKKIYGYIPRLGEFYQRIAVHFMTPQLSLGMDMVFRLFTAGIATGTIYLSSMFVFGRKLKLQYKDVIVTIGILLLLMLSAFSETYTYRFSYANNYVLGLLVAVAFLLPFRIQTFKTTPITIISAIVLGFLVGISTEIVPIAFLAIITAWVFVKLIKKEITLPELWKKYRLQCLLVIGLLAGLAFFYLGGGVMKRTSGGYGEVYDYISPFKLLKEPIETGYKLVHHVWYNLRYVFFAVPLMFMYVLIEKAVFKKNKKSLFWQSISICFCALFIGATSVIAVHDDLYPRFMIPVFMAILLSSMIFVHDVIEFSKAKEKVLKKATIVAIVSCSVLVVDMTAAFAVYNVKISGKLDAIQYNPGESITISPVSDYSMIPSPVFQLKQLPPFDWGPSSDYMKFGL